MTRSAKNNVIVGVVVLLVGILLGFVLVCFRPRIKILDARFHVFSISTSRGTNQVMYYDNQLKGRVMEGLSKLGLPVKPVPYGTFTLRDERNLWVSVVYNGNFATQELQRVEAELVNSDGKTFRLRQGGRQPVPSTKNYLGAWIVDFASQPVELTNKPNWNLRLKLPDGGGELAVIKLGSLQR